MPEKSGGSSPRASRDPNEIQRHINFDAEFDGADNSQDELWTYHTYRPLKVGTWPGSRGSSTGHDARGSPAKQLATGTAILQAAWRSSPPSAVSLAAGARISDGKVAWRKNSICLGESGPDSVAAGCTQSLTRAASATRASVDEFHGELDLARRSCGLADDAKPTPPDDIRRQSEVHGIEYVEELRPKLHCSQLAASPVTE
jgi:hypothetical protein